MIEYAKFLFKRILSRKSNIFLIISSIVLLSVILIMNIKSQDELRNAFDEQIKTNSSEMTKYDEKLSKVTIDSIEYNEYKLQIETIKSSSKEYKKMIKCYDDKDWSSFYKKYIIILEKEMQIIKKSNGASANIKDNSLSEMSNYYNEQLQYIKYLEKNNLKYENKDFPISGLSFITYISKGISPIVILLCCIYILAQVYTLDYSKGIDISKLFPLGQNKAFLVKIMVAICISIFIFLSILLCIFLLATLLSLNTGFSLPLMVQDSNTKSWIAFNLTMFLKQWLVIGILFYVCSCFITYILSLFIKEEGALFFITLCIILGLAYLPTFVDALKGVSHFLPTTYLDFVDVVSGKLAIEYSNVNISLFTGMLILIVSIVLQFVVCIMRANMKRIK